MKLLIPHTNKDWQPKPVRPPSADPAFKHMNDLQRATESLRYVLLCCEHWLSPSGDLCKWLRRNSYVGVWLLIPAVLVMPVIGVILWQLTGWLSMLTSIAGKLIVLPILVLLAFVVIRIAVALLRR